MCFKLLWIGSWLGSVITIISAAMTDILFIAVVFFIAHIANIICKGGIKAAPVTSETPSNKEPENGAYNEEEKQDPHKKKGMKNKAVPISMPAIIGLRMFITVMICYGRR